MFSPTFELSTKPSSFSYQPSLLDSLCLRSDLRGNNFWGSMLPEPPFVGMHACLHTHASVRTVLSYSKAVFTPPFYVCFLQACKLLQFSGFIELGSTTQHVGKFPSPCSNFVLLQYSKLLFKTTFFPQDS